MPDPVVTFGGAISDVLRAQLGDDLVGAYFVGSVALGGYVAGESDVDIVAVCESALSETVRSRIAGEVADATSGCPARGLEFTLYRRAIVSQRSAGAAFEVNANGGPRMERTARISSAGQHGFWYVLDRAIAHRHGIAIHGPPAAETFVDLPRDMLLEAMHASMRWHRVNERASLYSVLNAARAWRFVAEDVLGSKLEGAAWARERWTHPQAIDAAVDLRHGRIGKLDEVSVGRLLDHVEQELEMALAAGRENARKH